MPQDRFQDLFKNRRPPDPGDQSAGEDLADDHWKRFDAALQLMAEKLGEDRVDAMVSTIARIVQQDDQAGGMLLEKFPDMAAELLPAGGQSVADVFDMANQILPYGALLAVRFLEISPTLLSEGEFETLIKTAALACSISQINGRTAEGILVQSPAILQRIGFEGLRQVSSFAAAVARFSWAYSLKALEESPIIIDCMTKAGGESSCTISLYRLAALIAAEDWNTAIEIVPKSPAITAKLALQNPAFPSLIFQRALDIAVLNVTMVAAFLDTAPELIEHLGFDASESVWQCALSMAADSPVNATAFLTASPAIVGQLKTRIPDDRVRNIFELAYELSGIDSQLALKFTTASVELVERLDAKGLKTIADMSAQMARISRAAAGSFLDVSLTLINKTGLEGLSKIHTLGMEMAGDHWETASRLLLKSPDLIDRLGVEGLKMIGNFATSVARESWSVAVQLLDKCPVIIDGLLQQGDASLINDVCRLGGRIVKHNARLALSLLDRSPEIIRLSGFNGLETIENLARQIGAESWTTAVGLLESSPRIIERVGLEGLARISDLAREVARQNSYGAVSLLEKSPEILDRLLIYGDLSLALRVYAYAAKLVKHDWILASTLLEESPSLMSRIGAEGLLKLFDRIDKTGQDNGKIAKRLLDVSPAVIDKTGFEGLEILADCAATIGKSDWQAALSVLEKSPRLIDQLEHGGDQAVSSAVYGLATIVARTSVAAAVKLLEQSPEFIQWVGLDGFGRIASFIERTAQEDEAKALFFLSGDSPAFSNFMENLPKGLELKTIKPVLSTYLRALLGRRVEIAEAETVYTDGRKIYLPRRIRDFSDAEDNFKLYKVFATHQEAHLEYGSYEFDLLSIPETVHEITAFYATKIQADQSDIDAFTHLFPEPMLAQDLFNLMEDFRIESILKNEYPALGDDIEAMHRHMIRKRRPTGKMVNGKQRAVEMISQGLFAGKIFTDDADPAIPIFRATLDWSLPLQQPTADVHDAARIVSRIYKMIDQTFTEPYRTVKPLSSRLNQDAVSQNIGSFGKTSRQIQNRMHGQRSAQRKASGSDVEAQSNAKGDTTPSSSKPHADQVAQRQHQTGRDQKSFRGHPAGAGSRQESKSDPHHEEEAVGATSGMQYNSPEKIERMLRALYREKGITPKEIERRVEALHPNDVFLFLRSIEASLDKKTELQSERGTSLYSEWGEDINDYRSNWARVREQTQTGTALTFYRETADRYAGLLKKIRREFQMLKPEAFSKRKRQFDGDDIDLDAVVEFWSDRKAGISPSEKNYTVLQKRKRDIAVAFLIDMSRSTKGDTIDREKESLIIMSEALHEVGDAFAIFGFSGDNRDNIDYYRIKDFDDAYDISAKKRISAIEDHFENRDGAAIRHTVNKLRRRPERTKLLILLSDGKPVDKEYSGTYAIEDTRMALKEAQHFGIKTFCITVDQTAAEYLPRMYSHSSWTVIDDVVKLPEKITRIYRMLTA